MDFMKKSKVAPSAPPAASDPGMQRRRKSLIEDYYAWRQNEFEAALMEAARQQALHHTPPASPVAAKKKTAKIDGKAYEKEQRKKLLEEVGDHSLDIFKPHKKKKFAMYPVVPHTPDETPCMSPNESGASLASSYFHHDHHNSFPHLPEIEESEHEDEDTPTKPIVFNFNSNSSLNKKAKKSGETVTEANGVTDLEKKLLATNEKKRSNSGEGSITKSTKKRAPPPPTSQSAAKRRATDMVDLEKNMKVKKFSKWEIVQEFVPWVMIVTSIIQVALFIVDRDEFFQLLVFAPKHLGEMWRFVTYIFLHTNFTHLALNVVIQILLAIPLEFEQSHGRVAVVYFGGSILGACGVMLFGPKILVVGASAGAYSLLMSHIPHTLLNRRTIRYRNVRLGVVFFLCACDLIYTITHIFTNGNSEPKIGVWAHVFGAIGGLLLGMVFYTFIDPEDAMAEHLPKNYLKIRRASIGALLVIFLISFIYGVVATH